MKLRSTILTILAFLLLVLGGIVQAQDDMGDMGFDPCFGLAEADCAVITAASENGLGDAETFTVDVDVDFAGSDLAGLFEAVALFQPDLDLSMLGDLNDATFTLNGSFDVAVAEDNETGINASGSLAVSHSQNGGDVTERSYDIVLMDDVLYANDGEGWKSLDLVALSENEQLGALFGTMGMDMGDSEDADASAASMFDPAALGGVIGLIDLPGLISYERSGDDFVLNVDFSVLSLLNTEEYEDMYTELILSASEVDPTMAFMIPSLISIFESGTFNVVQTVDTEANIVTGITLDTDLALSLELLTGSPDVATIDLGVVVGISNLDNASVADAPADAEDITDMVIADIMAQMEAMEETDE